MPQLSIGNLVLGNKPAIKSFQYGYINMNGVSSNTATINAVDTNNAFVVWIFSDGNADDARGSAGKVVLTNSTTVTASRTTSETQLNVWYNVIEYYPGIIKSKQIVSRNDSGTINISTINKNKTFWYTQGCTTTNTGTAENGICYITNITSTTVTAATTWGSTTTMYFAIVEFY
jgi:hypothetical protein